LKTKGGCTGRKPPQLGGRAGSRAIASSEHKSIPGGIPAPPPGPAANLVHAVEKHHGPMIPTDVPHDTPPTACSSPRTWRWASNLPPASCKQWGPEHKRLGTQPPPRHEGSSED